MESTERFAVARMERGVKALAWVLLANLFLVGAAQLRISYGPVPYSLQTLGVVLLPLFFGGRCALYSTLLYLGEASLGLPVLSGWRADPLWMLSPVAGYLASFPVAALLVSCLLPQKSSWMRFASAFMAGLALIIFFGTLWLSLQIGWSQAIAFGFLPFVLTESMKGAVAASIAHALFSRNSGWKAILERGE